MRRTPLKRQSAKRKREYPQYRKLAAQFLLDHPYCQHWLAEHGVDEAWCLKFPIGPGLMAECSDGEIRQVPMATEVHHRRGRGKYYLDTSTFMACRPGHSIYIHQNLSHSRKMGYIL